MRALLVSALLALSLTSCKGEKGDPGSPGASAPSQIPPVNNQPEIKQYTGLVGSGMVFISPFMKANSIVLVYLENSASPGTYILLSFDPNNVGPWAAVSYSVSAITLYNCQSTAHYKVLVIEPE